MSTNFQPASENQFVVTLDNVSAVNHIVIFLTGEVPFSEGFGGEIYFGWPSEAGGISWQYLGYITNEKPSAIFKLGKMKPEDALANPLALAQGQFSSVSANAALLAISVEAQAVIAEKVAAANTSASTVVSQVEFCRKMAESFYNYASSFAITQAQMSPAPNVPFVPLNVVTQWYDSFQKKLANDPNFWKS